MELLNFIFNIICTCFVLLIRHIELFIAIKGGWGYFKHHVITMDDSLKSYRRAIIDTFNSQYASLSSALQRCMKEFAEEAFAAHLISESVMRSESFPDIASEFKSGLKFMNTVEEIQTHYHCFIRILEDLGGPADKIGRNLAAELSKLTPQYGMSC